jgi:hypothetical protein
MPKYVIEREMLVRKRKLNSNQLKDIAQTSMGLPAN